MLLLPCENLLFTTAFNAMLLLIKSARSISFESELDDTEQSSSLSELDQFDPNAVEPWESRTIV
jgi:hypothetical protein